MVAADAPTSFQRVQPLLQAADDPVQLPGLALAMSSCPPVAVATLALLTISILAMSSSFCARAATLAMQVVSPLPVSTSRSRDWTLLRR